VITLQSEHSEAICPKPWHLSHLLFSNGI